MGHRVVFATGLIVWVAACGGAARTPASPASPAVQLPAATDRPAGPGDETPALTGAAAGVAPCSAVAEIGGYEVPDWVRMGRASANETWPAARPSGDVRQALRAAMPGTPEAAALAWELAQALLHEAEASPDAGHRARSRLDAVRALAVFVGDAPAAAGVDTALFALGTELQRAGEPDRARQVFQHLVRAHPTSRFVPNAYLAFADYFFASGDMEAAWRFYDKVLELPRPQNRLDAYAQYRKASALARLEQTAEARALFEELEQLLSVGAHLPDAEALRDAVQRDLCALR